MKKGLCVTLIIYKNFYKIWCLGISRKFVDKIQIRLKFEKNKGYITWRAMFIYNNILLNFCWNKKIFQTKFDVRKSVYHHTIQIIQPTRCNSFTSLLLDVYVWVNMFRASPRPSSGAALGASGFTVGAWRLGRCWSWSARPRPTTLHPLLTNGKTRGS
jgi:hypothetical protein